jgi:diguanylate cyclase (GGDEF)-like protein/PAS domain S-box-containing protein
VIKTFQQRETTMKVKSSAAKKSPARVKTEASARPKRKTGESGLRYQMLLEQLPIGVYRTTPEGKIIEASPALAKMLGYSERELKKTDVKDTYGQSFQRQAILQHIKRAKGRYIEYKLRRKDGRTIWGRDYGWAIKGPTGRIQYYDGIVLDITREKRAEENLRHALKKLRKSNRERLKMIQKLENSTITDDLTGLVNRRGFYLMADQHLALAVRRKSEMYLLFLDMDDLKHINDTFGHHIGDAALVQMADIILRTFRRSDIKARMGGDEFAVFPIDSSMAGVEVALARFKKNIEDFNDSGAQPFKIEISSGVSRFDPEVPSTVEELIVRADKLMYEQKREKRK